MPWLIYLCAAGLPFFPGVLLILTAIVIRMRRASRWRNRISIAMALTGVAMVVVSAEALPTWLYILWVIAGAAWVAAGLFQPRKELVLAGWIALIASALAAGRAVRYHRLVTIPAGHSRIYVVDDSISAGLDSRGNTPWPALLHESHQMDVVDLSRAGCTITEATNRLEMSSVEGGIIVVEIGGNDMLNRLAPAKFNHDLDVLIGKLQSPSTRVVMFELPLFPFDNAYGIAQRRVADKYHLVLILRRYFAKILATPGATVDGIHLSAEGQRAMADLVCRVLRHI